MATTLARFRDQPVTFASGIRGRVLEIPSASPRNYHQAISDPAAMASVTIDGQLFLPPSGAAPFPVVMVVPGSLGIAPSHVAHAETLTQAGLAAFVLDPFGARGVTSTVSNQTQFSFAASAYDVLAAWRVLAAQPEIDRSRIGAQGHSRGGSAVLTAATRGFADAVLGAAARGLAAVLAAYPWSGHQFLDPGIGATRLRVLMGDRDDWCSVQQVQGHVQAIRLRGGAVTMRLFAGAAHSFDRGTPVIRVDEAAVAPGAPTTYLAPDGACVHPVTGQPDPALTDRDVAVYGLKAGYGVRGASLGSAGTQAEAFREDMVQFWTEALSIPGRPVRL